MLNTRTPSSCTVSPDLETGFAFPWKHPHLLDSASLGQAEIHTILETAERLLPILDLPTKQVPLLAGKVVGTLFYENSTRTRTSFELAAKYLGAETVTLTVGDSSVKKGETLLDTAVTLSAMGVDALVIRHGSSGVCTQLARQLENTSAKGLSLLNAGDGCHDHPTQGLLDLFTMQRHLKTLAGKKVVIVGDIAHSRVARSNLCLLSAFGAEIHLAGPQTLLPKDIQAIANNKVSIHTVLEDALVDADVVMALRLQLERQQAGLIPSLGEYTRYYGLTHKRIERYCKENVLVMHPGPVNRGVEITSELVDDPVYSLIPEQVRNGVAVRMALLYLLIAKPAGFPVLETETCK